MILPILVCVFGSFSFVSILANAVVTPFAFLIVIGGLLGGFLYAFPILRFIAYPLLLIAGIVAKYFIFIISLLARIPFASVYSRYGAIYFWLLIFYSALLYAIFRRKRLGFLRRSFVTLICFICCVSLVLCCAATVFIQFNTFEVIAFDCSGELAVAVIRDKNIALFGCSRNGSGTYHITSALSYRGISRLDYFVLTENSSRFGAQQIASEIPVNTLLVSDSNKQMQLFMENETAFIKNTASLPTGPIRLFGNTTLEMPEDASYAIVRNNDISVLISDSAIPDGQYSISILPDSKTYGDKLLSPITIFYGDTTPAYSTEHSTVLSSHGGSIIIKTIFSYTSIRRIVDG